MNIKNTVRNMLVVGTAGLLLAGCADDFLTKTSPNEVTTENFYKTADDAEAAIIAAYDPLQYSGLFANSYWSIGDITSDDADKGDGGKSDGPAWWEFDLLQVQPSNSLLTESWRDAYTGVYRANIVINRVPQIDMDEETRARIVAEAQFLRAFYYFYLTRLFGDVPLITTEPKLGELNVSRTPKEEVFALILSDFEAAAAVLPASYPSSDVGRATSGAANGMLARVHLWLKNWEEAAAAAKRVIDSGRYDLLPDYASNFEQAYENSVESVFEVQFMENGPNGPWDNTADGSIQHISTAPRNSGVPGLEGWGFDMPTQNLVDEFEEGDPRLAASVLMEGSTIGGKTYDPAWSSTGYNERKYLYKKEGFVGDGEDSPVNYRVIRFSDILLMYAEALNEMGRTSEAYAPLNRVRNRVGLPGAAEGMSQSAFRDAVYHERRVELALEGQRWFDLVRTGRALDVMSADERINIQPKHLVFPIPQSEREVNPELTQNPGY